MNQPYSKEWSETVEDDSIWTCMVADEANGFERGYITGAKDVGNDMIFVKRQFTSGEDHTMSKQWFFSHFMRVRGGVDADVVLVVDAVLKFNGVQK